LARGLGHLLKARDGQEGLLTNSKEGSEEESSLVATALE